MNRDDPIGDGEVVEIWYEATDDDGEVVDSSDDEPFAYLHGADNLVPGLERALTGRRVGDDLTVRVEPEDGYGERDDRPLRSLPRTELPADVEVMRGMQLLAEDDDGEIAPIWVVEADADRVVLDEQHPLAGVALTFKVSVLSRRAATAEELKHGHPHGPEVCRHD